MGDSDISSLIGYGTSQQKSISNYYGASAGPTNIHTSYGTTWNAPQTGKILAPASVQFYNQQAANIVNAAWTGSWTTANYGAMLTINDYGFNGPSGFGGVGILLVDGYGLAISSNLGSFRKNHGTGSGQHYVKLYYGGTLVMQSNQQYDPNVANASPQFGNYSGSPSIASRSSASSWRIEYYG
jgi:hypothetical protein